MSDSAKSVVAIVGASGGVGSAVLRQALGAGHCVRALARSRTKLAGIVGEETMSQLETFVEGDVSDPAALSQLLSGGASDDTTNSQMAEVVISCLGTPKSAKPCVCKGTESILKAMRTQSGGASSMTPRLIMVSSIGVGDSRDQGLSMAWVFVRCIIPLFLSKVFIDLERAEDVLWRENETPGGVRCTAVRPPGLNDKPGKGPAAVKMVPASELKAGPASIAREDVAAAMLRLVDPATFDNWAGKGVTVVVP